MSGANARRANGTRRNRLLKRLRAEQRPCWICGLPIDYSAPAGNPLAFECDELVPVSKGGSPFDPANVDAAHRCCNNWRRTKAPARVREVARLVVARFGSYGGALEFVQKAKAVERDPGAPVSLERPITTTDW